MRAWRAIPEGENNLGQARIKGFLLFPLEGVGLAFALTKGSPFPFPFIRGIAIRTSSGSSCQVSGLEFVLIEKVGVLSAGSGVRPIGWEDCDFGNLLFLPLLSFVEFIRDFTPKGVEDFRALVEETASFGFPRNTKGTAATKEELLASSNGSIVHVLHLVDDLEATHASRRHEGL
jgi:hypothetical protein